MSTVWAWCAHAYTGLGLVLAAWMAVAIVHGGDANFRLAFALMIAATAVDATDGYLARKAKVSYWTPGFDGRRLDDLIDFHTYTTLPLLLAWRAGILPPAANWVWIAVLVASAYGFCQVNVKTPDNYFLGFPSYWNIVVFYLYILRLPCWLAGGISLLLAVFTFVPTRYLYPSRSGPWSVLTNVLGVVWAGQLVVLLVLWVSLPKVLLYSSLIFPIYYLFVSWLVTFKRNNGRKSERIAGPPQEPQNGSAGR